MSSILKIQKLFETIAHKKINDDTAQKMIDEIHAKSIQPNEYANFLLNTDEYVNNKVLEFKITYFNRVGYYLSEETIDKFKTACKGKVIESADINNYVSNTDEFKDKYTSVIKVNCEKYGILNGMPNGMFLKKFQNDITYTIENLEQEMLLLEHKQDNSVIIDTNKPSINIQDMDLLLKIATEKQPPRTDNEIFYHVFGRPMYVEEYFKYVKFQKISNSKKQEYYEGLLKTHVLNFSRLSQIITSYQTDPFDDYDFVMNFLFEIDNPTFFDTIVDKILDSEQYNQSMKKHISHTYEKLFSTILNESEINYIFNIVKAKKLGIYDESLHIYLVDFKKESDDIRENITYVHQRVLERDPDQYELDIYSEMYRSDKDNNRQVSNSKLEPILIQSLEFHEILKHKITETYCDKNKTNSIPPSVLYSMLDALIKKIHMITLDNLANIIQSI